jgi:acyl-CoA thioester hydrolase
LTHDFERKIAVTANSEKPSTPRSLPKLEDFPHRTRDVIRYGDLDGNSHVNNAVFSTFFESGRVTLFRPPERGLMPQGFIWTLAHIAIDYLGEMQWPGQVETGIGLASLGRTSATFQQAIFFEGRCVATARAINVLIDWTTRKPVPIPDGVREKFAKWRVGER